MANAKTRARRLSRGWRMATGGTMLLVAATILPGCGGRGTSSPSPVTTPRPRVRSVIAEETFTLPPRESSNAVFYLHVATAVTGDLDITVDWTFASNDVDLGLARGTLEQALSPACLEDDFADCPLELMATAFTPNKPETMTVIGAPAGDYIVAVGNLGATDESGVVVVGFTTTAATTSPSVGAARSITASSSGSSFAGLR
ncbi:MAG: hypothetical protein PVJ73_01710 [Acidobacteriota bacterium]